MMKKLLKMTEIVTLSNTAVSKLSKIQNLIAQIEDLNENYITISRPYILYFPRNKPRRALQSGRAGLVHRFK